MLRLLLRFVITRGDFHVWDCYELLILNLVVTKSMSFFFCFFDENKGCTFYSLIVHSCL